MAVASCWFRERARKPRPRACDTCRSHSRRRGLYRFFCFLLARRPPPTSRVAILQEGTRRRRGAAPARGPNLPFPLCVRRRCCCIASSSSHRRGTNESDRRDVPQADFSLATERNLGDEDLYFALRRRTQAWRATRVGSAWRHIHVLVSRRIVPDFVDSNRRDGFSSAPPQVYTRDRTFSDCVSKPRSGKNGGGWCFVSPAERLCKDATSGYWCFGDVFEDTALSDRGKCVRAFVCAKCVVNYSSSLRLADE